MWGVTSDTVPASTGEAAGAADASPAQDVPCAADHDRRGPGRPRSARADEAIIDAVLDLLAEGTPAKALSIEAVAARAGVGKATIYRRWSNKESLIVDAVASMKGDPSVLPGTSLREDLLALLRPVGQPNSTRTGQIMPCLLSEIQRSPELNSIWQKITEPRRELLKATLGRGIESGELRPDLDLEITAAMLVGPLVARNVLLWNPQLDIGEMMERLVDAVLAGCAPRC